MVLKNLHYGLFTILMTTILNCLKIDEITLSPLTINQKNIYKEISTDSRILEQNISNETYKENTKNFDAIFKYKLNQQNPLIKIYCIFVHDKCVGYVGFFNDNKSPKTVFIYYAIHVKEWGKGIATLAVKKFLQQMLPILKENSINLIKATVKIKNIGSQKVLLKNKFKPIKEKNGELVMEYIDNQSVVYTFILPIK
jgi:RimJ/RimL family protein N-acetyltransferase